MTPTPPIQMRLPPDLLDRMDAEAVRSGRTRTALVIDAVYEYLLRRANERDHTPPPVEPLPPAA